MFDYRYYRTIRTLRDWKTGGHNIAEKRRKKTLSTGARGGRNSALSLSLLSTSASLMPFCSQSISRISHVRAVTVKAMVYHNHSHRSCPALLATSRLDLGVIRVPVQCLKKGQPMSPAGHVTPSHSGKIVTITSTGMTGSVFLSPSSGLPPLSFFFFFLSFNLFYFYFLHSRPPPSVDPHLTL